MSVKSRVLVDNDPDTKKMADFLNNLYNEFDGNGNAMTSFLMTAFVNAMINVFGGSLEELIALQEELHTHCIQAYKDHFEAELKARLEKKKKGLRK